jgi:hypothetical protein
MTAIDDVGNFQIYKYDGMHFNPVPGVGGIHISAAPGGIGVVAANHQITIYADFTPLPGYATAVASGWVIGCDPPDPSGKGRRIYRWDGGSQNWSSVPGLATSITVDLNGVPWVVNGLGQIFKWNGSAFARFPLANDSFVASSVASGSKDNETWAIRKSDSTIWNWNGSAWIQTAGNASKIALFSHLDACGDHLPWIINASQKISQYTHQPGCAPGQFGQVNGAALDMSTDYVLGADGVVYSWTNGTWTPYRTSPWGTNTRIGAGPNGLFAASTSQLGIQRIDLPQ